MLEYYERLFTTPPVDAKFLKVIILKVLPEVLEFLSDALRAFVLAKDNPNPEIVRMLFSIYEKVLIKLAQIYLDSLLSISC
jgi:hypothetical protein